MSGYGNHADYLLGWAKTDVPHENRKTGRPNNTWENQLFKKQRQNGSKVAQKRIPPGHSDMGDREVMRETSNFNNVELCRAGTWSTSAGKTAITPEHLSAAVEAFKDREIDKPPLKLGHTGGLALGDSLPAAGWVSNPRLSADGQTLIGDLVEVPRRLAQIIPTAYKRRSVEMDLNVTTASGKVYAAALTGLALLGAQAPAVKSLADVLTIYASDNEGGNKAHVDYADVDDGQVQAVVDQWNQETGNTMESFELSAESDQEMSDEDAFVSAWLAQLGDTK